MIQIQIFKYICSYLKVLSLSNKKSFNNVKRATNEVPTISFSFSKTFPYFLVRCVSLFRMQPYPTVIGSLRKTSRPNYETSFSCFPFSFRTLSRATLSIRRYAITRLERVRKSHGATETYPPRPHGGGEFMKDFKRKMI